MSSSGPALVKLSLNVLYDAKWVYQHGRQAYLWPTIEGKAKLSNQYGNQFTLP